MFLDFPFLRINSNRKRQIELWHEFWFFTYLLKITNPIGVTVVWQIHLEKFYSMVVL